MRYSTKTINFVKSNYALWWTYLLCHISSGNQRYNWKMPNKNGGFNVKAMELSGRCSIFSVAMLTTGGRFWRSPGCDDLVHPVIIQVIFHIVSVFQQTCWLGDPPFKESLIQTVWLVVWLTFFNFPIYWVSNHPNWRSYFSEGWPNHQPAVVGIVSVVNDRDLMIVYIFNAGLTMFNRLFIVICQASLWDVVRIYDICKLGVYSIYIYIDLWVLLQPQPYIPKCICRHPKMHI